MINRLEIMDRDTGATLVNLAFGNPLQPMCSRDVTVADDSSVTVGSVLAYAGHIWSSLVWTATDAGERATVKYGRFVAWIYR